MRGRLFPLVLLVVLPGCVAPPDDPPATPTPPPAGAPGAFALASPAFADGEAIPRKHTCDGEDISPPLAASGAPAASPVLALRVIDSDVPRPQAPLRDIDHWLAWNVPVVGGAAAFPEGDVPDGTVQGANVGGRPEYAGPCPPQGSPPHRYVFTLHALDAPLELQEGASRQELEAAIDGHVLASTTLTGLYARALT